MENIASTFDTFKKKLDRFNQNGGTLDMQKALPKQDFEELKEKISFEDEQRKKTIRERFKQFLHPVSREIEEDQHSLLTAWNLHAQVQEINAASSTPGTCIQKIQFSSPLTKKTEYTSGLKFAFLQAWFIKTQKEKAAVFMPELISDEKGAELIFTASDIFKMSPLLKEILSVI